MVCHECGKTVGDGDRFCTGCGAQLQPTPASGGPGATDVPDAAGPGRDGVDGGDGVDDRAGDRDDHAHDHHHDHHHDHLDDHLDDHNDDHNDDHHHDDHADDHAHDHRDDRADVEAAQTDGGERPLTTGPPATGDGGLDVDGGVDVDAGELPAAGAPPPPGTARASGAADLRTELLPVVDGDDDWGDSDPVWAVTAPNPVVTPPASVATGDLPSTEPITEVWMDSVPDAQAPPTPYDFVEREGVAATQAVPTATAEMPAMAAPVDVPGRRFRFTAVTFLGIVTGLVVLVSLFTTVVSVASDVRLTIGADAPFGFRTGRWIADDLADNLSIAGLVAAVSMVAGGVAASFGWRWGSGLAGGGGLATAGLTAMALGLAQIPIDAAHEFARIPPDEPFTLTITRDLGYWLLLAAGALGIVLFFASINDAFGDRRPGLNPWTAALGALATLVAATGPLLPENLAVFSDNWYVVDAPGEAPALLLVGRLVQLGLLVVSGVVGFLSVRRWGLGVAVGGALPIVWLAISTLFDLTDAPVGPGFRNPGADDMYLHGVTIIGVSAVAAMSVLAAIAAYDQGVRERH